MMEQHDNQQQQQIVKQEKHPAWDATKKVAAISLKKTGEGLVIGIGFALTALLAGVLSKKE